MTSKDPSPAPPAGNFIRQIIETDLAAGRYAARRWSGQPAFAARQAGGPADPQRIRTRFPPEPNGYLHLGHAKSICLNFGMALEFGGACHLRFDDTNPTREEQQFVDAIIDSVHWLGFDWGPHLYYASNYFAEMHQCAVALIERGHAYVDSQSPEEMRQNRGTLTEPGRDSPWRARSIAENLDLFTRMKAGEFPDGAHVLRAKIDMASPNINLRDPPIYRIRHAHHHNTGDAWCIYPMYTFAHPIEDALENVTHSLCTLEFEDQRPFYDWLLQHLAEAGCFAAPLPQQYEFGRLNLTYTVLSKRKLMQLVDEGHVEGWNDPRMPTLAGARRRGFTPEALRTFIERLGVSKSDSPIDIGVLENCVRDHLNEVAPRRIAVLDPVKLVIENYPDGQTEQCEAPNHPQQPDLGSRQLQFGKELWIEREDFMVTPSKGYFRLYPGNRVRLRYGYVVECTGYEQDADGQVTTVSCRYFPDSRSGSTGADQYKVKGNVHWVSVGAAMACEVRLYDRLFNVPNPGAGERDFLLDINPDAKRVVRAQLEPALQQAQAGGHFQFERHGYFVADAVDSRPGTPVFNRTVTLRDSWAKAARGR
ncbi:MAG TPA: glutamine--tRNA ligase/YqeY domain fusion protein [Steroidobacteraceae bacterium]|nr:glutamine--tRNA ligase/YqeY domain fusion protein [Steroidobacteraceae bacterium]